MHTLFPKPILAAFLLIGSVFACIPAVAQVLATGVPVSSPSSGSITPEVVIMKNDVVSPDPNAGVRMFRTSTGNIQGIKQTFTWNTSGQFVGFGARFKAALNSSSQTIRIQIYKLQPNHANEDTVVSTPATINFTLPATNFAVGEYLYVKLATPVTLEKGTTYGLHLVPYGTVSGQEFKFSGSNVAMRGACTNSNALGSLTSFSVNPVYEDCNFFITATSADAVTSSVNPLFVNKEHILNQKILYNAGNADAGNAVGKLIAQAWPYLSAPAKSVMDKTHFPVTIPNTISKHYYMSQAKYWWDPNPGDGILDTNYVRIDGSENPEVDLVEDNTNLVDLVKKTKALSLAYFFTGEERYAAKATELLRVWFLDTDTRMLPDLQYSGVAPGCPECRGSGIVDMAIFIDMVDWIALLEPSTAMTQTHVDGLKQWLDDYRYWMTHTIYGERERSFNNNHLTYYDLQLAAFATFTGHQQFADSVLNEVKGILSGQMNSYGKQVLEMARPGAYGYSLFNLEGFFRLALLSERSGLVSDLWQYQASNGTSLQKGIEYIAPYLVRDLPNESGKPPVKRDTVDQDKIYTVLSLAAKKYPFDPYYTRKWAQYGNGGVLPPASILLDGYQSAITTSSVTTLKDSAVISLGTIPKTGTSLRANIQLSNNRISKRYPSSNSNVSDFYTTKQVNGQRRITQVFTWNSDKPLSGFGLLVSSKTGYVFKHTQKFTAEIHKLNSTTKAIVETTKSLDLYLHSTDVSIQKYVDFSFTTPVQLENGAMYGLHLMPVSNDTSIVAFTISGIGTGLLGYASYLNAPATTTYAVPDSSVDFTSYFTTISDGLYIGNVNAPTVSLVSPTPASSSYVDQGSAITLKATASDAGGSVAYVEFFDGATLLGAAIAPGTDGKYVLVWNGAAAGSHTVKAVATDNLGKTTTSSTVTFTVNPLPIVSIASPTNNSTYLSSDNITLTASASDADAISKVIYRVNGVKLDSATSSPYTKTWSSHAAGIYSLTAEAIDSHGARKTSAAVQVNVANVMFVEPMANQDFYYVNATHVSLKAAAANGTTEVKFYNGATLLGTDGAVYPPSDPYYKCDMYNLEVGTYTITAKALIGGVESTTNVTFTVGNPSGTNLLPAVTILTPSNGATFPAPSHINISASASDPDAYIAQMQYTVGARATYTVSSPYPRNGTYYYTEYNVPSGTYLVKVKAIDTRGGYDEKTVTIIVGSGSREESIMETEGNTSVGIHPNPTTGWLCIPTWAEGDHVQLLDTKGKLMMQSNSANLDLGELPNGMYILMHNDKAVKIVKE